jgi:hypothetical protein
MYLFFEMHINQYDVNIHEAAFLYFSLFPPMSGILGKLEYDWLQHSSLFNSL